MHTLMTVIRKRPEISTEDFRRFMKSEYGPTYAALPQVREYVQYYLGDLAADGAEDAIDAIVRISFDSEETMREALATEEYRKAHELRQKYMRDTSAGIRSTLVQREVRLV
ncbi:EthD domain-containing protein [Streptomyces sp. OE57]|uniref:EthD domain-containing protein n=1 Tax=Streptomyces lacaronensis TaxID=3379885 RepID=UPI0039B7867D